MYTNDLLEEKYRAQRELAQEAEVAGKDYLDLIESEVKDLFRQKGWNLEFSERKGGFLTTSQKCEYGVTHLD